MTEPSHKSADVLGVILDHYHEYENIQHMLSDQFKINMPGERLQMTLDSIRDRYGEFLKVVGTNDKLYIQCIGGKLPVEQRMTEDGLLDYLYIFPPRQSLNHWRMRFFRRRESPIWMKCQHGFASALQLLLPLAFLASVWNLPTYSLNWYLSLTDLISLLLWFRYATSWAVLGYKLRHVWFILYLLGGASSILRTPTDYQSFHQGDFAVEILYLALFCIYGYRLLRGRRYDPNQAINLSFPFMGGEYMVVQGGSNASINYHHKHPLQKFALDIVKLNRFGARASAIFPSTLNAYSIYDEMVYSPCSGFVTTAIDHFVDRNPPHPDAHNPAGNHIVIQTGDAMVFMAHLQYQSILVRSGQYVEAGQPIAKVGHTGNSSEPHLHIHVEQLHVSHGDTTLRPIPALFNGRFLVRNSIVRPRDTGDKKHRYA